MMFLKRLGYLLPWRRRAAERDMQEELRSIAAMARPARAGQPDARRRGRARPVGLDAARAGGSGRPLRDPHASKESGVHAGRRAVARDRHRRQHGALHADQLGDVEAPAGERSGASADDRTTEPGDRNSPTGSPISSTRSSGITDRRSTSPRTRIVRLDASIDGRVEPTLDAQLVTGEYFPILGLRPAVGRLFDESDDRVPMGHQVAVLSHTYWQRRFGGEADGARPLDHARRPPVHDRRRRAGGVLRRRGRHVAEPLPAGDDAAGAAAGERQPARTTERHLDVAPCARPAEARRAARTGRGPAQRAWPARPRPSGGCGNKFTGQLEDARLVVTSAAAGLSDLRRQFSQPLFLLLGVAGLVLLIACANVGHLVLARSAARRSEFALRLALGASRGRVMRQVLVEGLVLAGIGAAAGVALAYWAAPALVQFASAGQGRWFSICRRIFACWRSPLPSRSPPGCSSPALRRFAPRAPTGRLTGRADLGAHAACRCRARARQSARHRPGGAVGGVARRRRPLRADAAEPESPRARDRSRARDRRAARAARERPANARHRPDARPDLSRPAGPHRGPSGRALGEPRALVAARAEHAGFAVRCPPAASLRGAQAPSCIRATSRRWGCRSSGAATSPRTTCGPTPRPSSWSTSRSCANSSRGASRSGSDTA